jgi:hypothetical protein
MHRVYIAYPSSEDAENLASRERIVSQLRQYEGVEILPSEPAATITDEQISASLASSDLSVHFFGITPGRCDEHGHGIVQRQFELAEAMIRDGAASKGGAGDPRIIYLKSRALCEIEGSTFEPQEWEFNATGAVRAIRPGRELRAHLHFLCSVLRQTPPVRVFYSYSRSDREHLEKLRRCLISSRRNGRIIEWYDGFLEPGDDWNEETIAALDECDVLVFLSTPESVASTYAYHKEYRRAKGLGKKVIVVAASAAPLAGTGIEENQMIPLDESSRLRPVDEWVSVNKAWTSVAEQLYGFIERCSREMRGEGESIPIEPCSDPGELKELLEGRLRLRSRAPSIYNEKLGPMVLIDWVKRRPDAPEMAPLLNRTCRSTWALGGLLPSRKAAEEERSYAARMYGFSDAVLIYCDDRKPDTAKELQQWIWEVERRRSLGNDCPKCIAVLDFSGEEEGISRREFVESLPDGGTVMVIGSEEREPHSLLEPVWRRIGA